jgi:hypothetical protein
MTITAEDLAALRKEYEDARDLYAVTHVRAHWEAACEAQRQWVAARFPNLGGEPT